MRNDCRRLPPNPGPGWIRREPVTSGWRVADV